MFRVLILCVLGQCAAGIAWADTEGNFQAGLKSYREGDVVGAMVPLRAAALENHPKAQALLAEILDRTDFDEDALALFRKSAEQGDPDGMFGLGAMLVSGEGGEKDEATGRVWILKAAEAGQLLAINVIAQAYLKGELGYNEADSASPDGQRWIKLAAENAYLPAIDALAVAYETGTGLGLQADAVLAEHYRSQANRIRNLDPAKGKKKQRRQ